MYCEKRLGCIHDIPQEDVCRVYKDVAFLHTDMGDHQSALYYHQQLLNVANNARLTTYVIGLFVIICIICVQANSFISTLLKGTEPVLKTVLKYFEKGTVSFLPDLKRTILP